MTFAVTPQITLASAIANGGTFSFPYPSGEAQGSAWSSTGHILVDNQGNIYTSGFSVSFGASAITVTNTSLGTLAAGRSFRLQGALDAAAPGLATWRMDETPTGTVNGVNDEFTLDHTPISGTLSLYKNGMRMTSGGVDFTLSGDTITYESASIPETGDAHVASYSY